MLSYQYCIPSMILLDSDLLRELYLHWADYDLLAFLQAEPPYMANIFVS